MAFNSSGDFSSCGVMLRSDSCMRLIVLTSSFRVMVDSMGVVFSVNILSIAKLSFYTVICELPVMCRFSLENENPFFVRSFLENRSRIGVPMSLTADTCKFMAGARFALLSVVLYLCLSLTCGVSTAFVMLVLLCMIDGSSFVRCSLAGVEMETSSSNSCILV